METENPLDSKGVEGGKKPKKFRPLRNLLFIDLLKDRDSWPAIAWAVTTLLLGTLFYHWFEGWSYIDSLYFCVVSLGTVGYGDFTPTTPGTKLFTIFYLINGIAILLVFFDRIRIVRSDRYERPVTRRTQD